MNSRETARKEIARVDLEFKRMLKEIQIERIKRGRDQEPISSKRLSLAVARIPNIREVLCNAEIKNEKKQK